MLPDRPEERRPTKPCRIVWHLGLQKTGTSTIQRTLRDSASLFREHGAVFIKGDVMPILRASRALIAKRGGERQKALVDAVRQVVDAAVEHPAGQAIVSAETILGADVYTSDGDIIEWAAMLIPALAEAIAPHESHFVLYTRPFEQWARSAYNQSVKKRRYTVPYRAWREAIPFSPDWATSLAILPHQTHRITVIDMSTEVGGLLGRGLFQVIGLDEDEIATIAPPEVRNESLPEGAVVFMRAVNESDLDDRDVQIIRRLVVRQRHLFRSSERPSRVDAEATLMPNDADQWEGRAPG